MNEAKLTERYIKVIIIIIIIKCLFINVQAFYY